MDYALAPVVEQALVAAVRLGVAGYPAFDDGGELGEAYAGFARGTSATRSTRRGCCRRST